MAIDAGYIITSFIRIPLSPVICSEAIFPMLKYWVYSKSECSHNQASKPVFRLLKEVNWGILVFMVGIFIIVHGLRHAGVIDFFSVLFASASELPSYLSFIVPALIVTIFASIMNNWPMTLLGLVSIRQTINYGGLTSN